MKLIVYCPVYVIGLLCLVLVVPAACEVGGRSPQAGAVYFVSLAGSDDNDGSKARPFATLARARQAVLELKKRGLGEGGVTVRLRGGVYALGETFALTEANSGAAGAPVTFAACENEDVRIIGGVVLRPRAFRPAREKAVLSRLDDEVAGRVLVADLSGLGLELAPWPDWTRSGAPGQTELFFNSKRMPIARWPNEGWAKTGKIIQRSTATRGRAIEGRSGTFSYTGNRPGRWKVSEGVWISGYLGNQWFDEAVRAESIDTEKRAIKLSKPNWFGLGANRRYRAVNLLEELDAPGEWYLDVKRAALYFLPPAGARMKDATIVLSVLREPLVHFKGASHVTLEGLTLEATRGSAIRIEGGRDCRVVGCRIRNTGKRGVEIASGSGHGVAGCEIAHTGTVGILLSGGDRKTLTPARNFATDNCIHHFSQLQRSWAPGIMLNGVGNRVGHNLMHDAPHEAIHFLGNEHVIEFNEIRHICKETNDVGAIYSGRDWTVRGNVIRYNFIHHVQGIGNVRAQGIYLDDAASGVKVYGNVLYKVHRALLVGGGRDNVIENNLAVDCTESLWFDSRGLGKQRHCVVKGGPWYKNLMAVPYDKPPWSTRYPRLAKILEDNPGAPKGNIIRYNVFKSSRAMFLTVAARQFSRTEDNLVTDKPVGVADVEKMDFRLRPDSPVFEKLPEFQPIPFDKIGPRRRPGSTKE
ncbi:MAG: right-handed parallel beta-helix repeat-containing protein [Planctomycetota bacterium]|jgi:hypothetical protein